ncbi:unnamed protein product [Miscanthus lutarioriparius]|uniref:Uncharacterized protein n=1 Tax=Miscanthus lutarioriparius TaxID=422564 RepID=A0A811RQ57_9POAL|nr:unnamed protein product [Miscanthus lutarioriparius]
MDAQLHYSRRLLLQLQGPAACPSPGAVPDARPVPAAAGELNSDAILTLALLTCGLVAALTFRVVLQCALRVTRGACCGGADDDDDPEEQEQDQQHAGGGAGLAQLQAAAAAPAGAGAGAAVPGVLGGAGDGRVVAVGVRHLPHQVRPRGDGARAAALQPRLPRALH